MWTKLDGKDIFFLFIPATQFARLTLGLKFLTLVEVNFLKTQYLECASLIVFYACVKPCAWSNLVN